LRALIISISSTSVGYRRQLSPAVGFLVKMCLHDLAKSSLSRLAILSFLLPIALLGRMTYHASAQNAQATQPSSSKIHPRSTQTPSSQTRKVSPKLAPSPRTPETHGAAISADAQPAAVTLENGTLTVQANNSDLAQILHEVSQKSGMVIEGDVKDARVFGNYGPQNPSAILSDLLAGLGYNIMMVGSARGGAPGRLILSGRTGGPSPPLPEKSPERSGENTSERLEEPQLGPGAIAHPPPPPSDDPRIRAQQNQRRLQQMHDSQNQEIVPP